MKGIIMTIGIFTAMQKEAASFLSDDVVAERVGDFVFYLFDLGKNKAVLCCPPYVGEIAAAAATQLLITAFHVDMVFNFGVVGALTESIACKDFVYVRDVVHYDMDTSVIDDEPIGRYACFDGVAVKANEFLLNKAIAVKPYPLARCASADKFVDGVDRKLYLRNQFDADICDMESAGVLFVCNFNHIPCLLVKRVSDSLGGGYGEYRRTVHDACRDFWALATAISDNL